MEAAENTISLSKYLTVIISGLFGLSVAVITWILANYRENKKLKNDFKISNLNEKKEVYVSLLSTIDKTIRATRKLSDYGNIDDEFSIITAKLNILGSNEINNSLSKVSERLYDWSSEYKKGMPKKFGDTNFAMVSTEDFEFRENAKKLYPELMKEIYNLTTLIKNEISTLETKVIKSK